MGEELYVVILQLAMLYLVPSVALIKAIYNGLRGRLPEGLRDIGAAGVLAGMGAVADGNSGDLGSALLEVVGNAAFISGLLTFILIYLLRLPNWGLWFDAFIGGIIGAISWVIWSLVLNYAWPTLTFPLVIIGGALVFVSLRRMIRAMYNRLVAFGQLITRLIRITVGVAVFGGIIWVIGSLLSA